MLIMLNLKNTMFNSNLLLINSEFAANNPTDNYNPLISSELSNAYFS